MTRQISSGINGEESLFEGTLDVPVGGGVAVWPWNDSNELGQTDGGAVGSTATS